MKRLLPTLLLALAPACDSPAEDSAAALVDALPTPELFDVDLPGEAEGALSVVEAPLLGAPSGLRELTAGVRKLMKLGLGGLLEHLEKVTAREPIFESDDRVVWRVGLGQRDLEYGVVLRREGERQVVVNAWLRAPRPEAPNGPAEWRFLMAGRITPTPGGGSRGALWVDLDNDLKPKSEGKLMALWSAVDGERTLEVVVYDGTPDGDELGRITRTFRYEDHAGEGVLAFDAGEFDVHGLAGRLGAEHVRVVTRWTAAGAMRADFAASGLEVKADGFRVLMGSECWQAPSSTILYEQRLGLPLGNGAAVSIFDRGERASCPYPAQEAPVVPPPGAAPIAPERPQDLDDLDQLDEAPSP